MPNFETVELMRDCETTMIPSGEPTKLTKGSRVHITQSLGGTFTVMSEQGFMVRIEGKDADAIGKDKPAEVQAVLETGEKLPVETLVWDQLKTCYDPEIPVDIVDLGLVYECKVTPLPNTEGEHRVDIKMTLTAPGCGMGESIRMDAMQKIQKLPGVRDVFIDLVWEPQWDRSMMTDAAKLKLGMM